MSDLRIALLGLMTALIALAGLLYAYVFANSGWVIEQIVTVTGLWVVGYSALLPLFYLAANSIVDALTGGEGDNNEQS